MTRTLFTLLSLLLISNRVCAQVPLSGAQVEAVVWGSDFNENFGDDDVKDEWKEYSAVILAKDERHSYKKTFLVNEFTYSAYQRFRVKIQTEKALEEYGTMTFNTDYGKTRYYQGVKVIKPDGTEYHVNIAKEGRIVQVENRGRTYDQIKLAVPNLSVGDIIDYYSVMFLQVMAGYFIPFDPEIYRFTSEYPIKYQRVSFDIQRKTYINLQAMNGAPELKKNESEESDEYYAEERDREPVEIQSFMFPYRQLPYIKLRVCYSPGLLAVPTIPFIGEPSVPKTNIEEQEIYEHFKKSLSYIKGKKFGKVNRFFKKEFDGDPMDTDTLFRMAYYKIRNLNMVERAEHVTVGGFNQAALNSFYHNKFNSMKLLERFLTKKGIENYYFVTVPRYFGTIDEVAFHEELIYGIHVITDKGKYYLTDFGVHDTPDVIDSDILGADALFWKAIGETHVIDKRFRESIPEGDYTENGIRNELVIDLDSVESNRITVDYHRSIYGIHKSGYQNMLLDYYDFQKEEVEVFGESRSSMLLTDPENRRKYLDETRPENRRKAYRAMLKQELEFETDSTGEAYDITATGRWGGPMQVGFTYTTEELIAEIGGNQILEIGKLIEKQVELEPDQLTDRQYDIYEDQPRKFEVTMSLEVPDGYTIEGLEGLKYDITNEAGSFVSTVEQDGNEVRVYVQKSYYNIYQPKENWPLMVEFLKAANSFSKSKLLLKQF